MSWYSIWLGIGVCTLWLIYPNTPKSKVQEIISKGSISKEIATTIILLAITTISMSEGITEIIGKPSTPSIDGSSKTGTSFITIATICITIVTGFALSITLKIMDQARNMMQQLYSAEERIKDIRREIETDFQKIETGMIELRILQNRFVLHQENQRILSEVGHTFDDEKTFRTSLGKVYAAQGIEKIETLIDFLDERYAPESTGRLTDSEEAHLRMVEDYINKSTGNTKQRDKIQKILDRQE